jgi:hypothetical protein
MERGVRSNFGVLTSSRFQAGAVGVVAVPAALLAWLWPIGIGGEMPVGGDVTQFFMGLMAVLGESLRAGRLPVWNDLWGYGFPGLAESQMGVFYPIHIVVYRLLAVETAYVVSLVVHTLWGGLGAFWAARRLRISCAGSALAAFSWSACGFYLIHLAHPWSYTTGCWMPWAWGLALCSLAPTGACTAGSPLLLSMVLALQILPGHFQLAFLTQFGIVVILFWSAIDHGARRAIAARRDSEASAALSWRGAGGIVLALFAVFPLAAIQLWPTARLAGLAEAQRDFEYLSGFASTPFHLVNYVAPGFFHRSPLWRPLVWDPFHTSPEEQLAYIGLVPLFLAGMAMLRQWRQDADVRLLAILFVVTLVLSLGPYAPGFWYLIKLPGFSFFRAPSRWSLATALALALLAGKGFDLWLEWPRPGRSLQRFGLVALCWVAATVSLIELALLSTSKPGWPALARGFQRVFDVMPWTGDPTFAAFMAGARSPAGDPSVPAGLNRRAFLQRNANSGSFASDRGAIYTLELWETTVLLLALLVVARLNDRGRLGLAKARWLLAVLTVLDLWVLGRHRLIDVGPIRSLAEQSTVLASLAREPRGTRVTTARIKNMPMVVGGAPILAYRTLDLPAVPELSLQTQGPLGVPDKDPPVWGALRATGTGVRIFDPIENRINHMLKRTVEPLESIEDPALASWMFGASWVADNGPWARTFSIWHAANRPARAWFVPWNAIPEPAVLENWSGDPREILEILDVAEPLAAESPRPEEWVISVRAEEPGWVIVSQLADPQWNARWIGLDGQGTGDGEILPAFPRGSQPGGWQRVEVPAAGRWTLRLEYDARDVAEGAAISTVAWLSWVIAALFTAFERWRGRSVPVRDQTEA